MTTRIALIAHDHKKDDMVAFAQTHQAFLSQCDLLATGTTGGRLEKEVGRAIRLGHARVGGFCRADDDGSWQTPRRALNRTAAGSHERPCSRRRFER